MKKITQVHNFDIEVKPDIHGVTIKQNVESVYIEKENIAELCDAISPIDWNKLREKFFNECTEEALKGVPTSKKINLAPHDLFEWFKKELTA